MQPSIAEVHMLAATYTQGGTFAVTDVPEPRCGEDQVRVRVKAASICGTDIKIVHNGHRKLHDGQRIVLGHEFVGEIAEVGSRVRGYSVGQRVGVAPNAGCGKCPACVRGKTNYCPEYTAFGIDRDGGHAPFVVVPAAFVAQGNVIPLPDPISDREASVQDCARRRRGDLWRRSDRTHARDALPRVRGGPDRGRGRPGRPTRSGPVRGRRRRGELLA